MEPVRNSTFVYVGNSDSQNIGVLKLGTNGDLASVATVAVPGPARWETSSRQ